MKPKFLLPIIALTVLVGCTPTLSGDDKGKLATAEQMIDAWNTMDWERMLGLFAEDGVLHSMMSEPIVGREVIRARLADMLGNIERIELEIRNIGIVNDVVVLERVDDFTYKGKRSRVPVVGILQIADGKVQEWREYYDRATLATALAATGRGQAGDYRDADAEVLAVINSLQEDWNRGDMQAYLDAYWDDENLALVFGNQVVAGKRNMKRMFETAWPDEVRMGDFETDNESVAFLSPDLAIVKGTFEHQFTDSLVIGAFTQVLKHMNDGKWRIVHEHTSRKNPGS